LEMNRRQVILKFVVMLNDHDLATHNNLAQANVRPEV